VNDSFIFEKCRFLSFVALVSGMSILDTSTSDTVGIDPRPHLLIFHCGGREGVRGAMGHENNGAGLQHQLGTFLCNY
jgi:hypothetical protein